MEEEEFDMCPMGCGRTTEDPYGGPCTACWDRVDELERAEMLEEETPNA